jgi:hypothetical protein
MHWKKTTLLFLMAYVVVFLALLLGPTYIHRREFDAAFLAWYRNPSVQNEATLNRERQRNRVERRSIAAGLAFVIVLAGGSGYRVVSRLTKSPPRT